MPELIEIINENLTGFTETRFLVIVIITSILTLTIGSISSSKLCKGSIFIIGLTGAFFYLPSYETLNFNGNLLIDHRSVSIARITIMSTLGLLLFDAFWKRAIEQWFLLLALLAGSLLMMIGQNLLIIYLSIEFVSLTSYVLTSFQRKKSGYEATLKYFLVGCVVSAVMLYGISLIYGGQGHLYLPTNGLVSKVSVLGWLMFLSGLLFKTSLFPIHGWVPNTYQEAPTEVSAFLAVVPKLSGFVLLGVILDVIQNQMISNLLLLLGLATMVIGTFGAISQQNVKRLISYGAIAHSGFILPLILLPDADNSFLVYCTVYGIMTYAAFYFISVHETFNFHTLDNYKGVGMLVPSTAIAGVIFMVALVGLPPTSGFTIKFFLFVELWKAYLTNGSISFLIYFIIGILTSVISLFFYLRIPYISFFKKSEVSFAPRKHMEIIMIFFALFLLFSFLLPGTLTIAIAQFY